MKEVDIETLFEWVWTDSDNDVQDWINKGVFTYEFAKYSLENIDQMYGNINNNTIDIMKEIIKSGT